jgi:hypothetical protein
MDAITPLTLKIVLYAVMPLSKTAVTPLSKPQVASPDVKGSVASQIPEDFTAHLEMHPLRHIRRGHTSFKIVLYVEMPLSKTTVTPLSKPRGGSLDVKASVAFQIPEDFTAHLEMHFLRHIRRGHMSMTIVVYAVMPLSKTAVTPLSKPRGGSLDVKASVTSQIPEDFTAHLEMHPLRHIHHLATCTILILHHLKELKLRQVPSESIKMNLQDIPQNTEGY